MIEEGKGGGGEMLVSCSSIEVAFKKNEVSCADPLCDIFMKNYN